MSTEPTTGSALVPAIADDSLVAIADAAEKRIDAINRIKRAALKVTNAHDWVDENGKPYLQASGAEKVARLFGISWRIDEPTLEREEDGHFAYTFKGYFRLGEGAEIEAIGVRGSRDPFFSKSGKVPPSEIDRGDVKKAALTNCLGNGITRLLGIRNLTWAEIGEAGIKAEGSSRVEYQQREMSQEAKDQRAEIRRMLLEMASGDEEAFRTYLAAATKFTASDGHEVAGKTDLDKVSERAVGPTYRKVKDAYEKWTKQRAGDGTPEAAGNG